MRYNFKGKIYKTLILGCTFFVGGILIEGLVDGFGPVMSEILTKGIWMTRLSNSLFFALFMVAFVQLDLEDSSKKTAKLIEAVSRNLAETKVWRELAAKTSKARGNEVLLLVYYFSRLTKSGAVTRELISDNERLWASEKKVLLELYEQSLVEPPLWDKSWIEPVPA